MRVLVTGGSGFLGQASANALMGQADTTVRTTVRCAGYRNGPSAADVVIRSLSPTTDWSDALAGVDVVVHTAARVHMMNDHALDPLTEFRIVNVEGTLNLARQAAAIGVKRFVFISSIKVNGEGARTGIPYTPDDSPAPEDAYGISKAEAEAGLKLVSQETGMEVVVIRPPLVYGPGVKGNFSSLLRLVTRGLPLPFGGATQNRRSLVALDNLVDLIMVCVKHPNAANQTFLVSDGNDLSTAELLQKIGVALQRPARLLYMPVGLLIWVATLLGKKAVAQRLLGSLQVDISKTRKLLGWEPPITVDEGLRRLVE